VGEFYLQDARAAVSCARGLGLGARTRVFLAKIRTSGHTAPISDKQRLFTLLWACGHLEGEILPARCNAREIAAVLGVFRKSPTTFSISLGNRFAPPRGHARAAIRVEALNSFSVKNANLFDL